uniref:Putative secreted protein n=1 Tax=Anopheles darlingi TaxID=43151 RepID=A0A2M4D2E0_ANODA
MMLLLLLLQTVVHGPAHRHTTRYERLVRGCWLTVGEVARAVVGRCVRQQLLLRHQVVHLQPEVGHLRSHALERRLHAVYVRAHRLEVALQVLHVPRQPGQRFVLHPGAILHDRAHVRHEGFLADARVFPNLAHHIGDDARAVRLMEGTTTLHGRVHRR